MPDDLLDSRAAKEEAAAMAWLLFCFLAKKKNPLKQVWGWKNKLSNIAEFRLKPSVQKCFCQSCLSTLSCTHQKDIQGYTRADLKRGQIQSVYLWTPKTKNRTYFWIILYFLAMLWKDLCLFFPLTAPIRKSLTVHHSELYKTPPWWTWRN